MPLMSNFKHRMVLPLAASEEYDRRMSLHFTKNVYHINNLTSTWDNFSVLKWTFTSVYLAEATISSFTQY